MLTRTAEHALRAVIYLARQPRGSLVSAETIAAALGAPTNYMAKTLGVLASADLVKGRRGPRGGYRLLADPDALTVAGIAELFEGEHGIEYCLLTAKPCEPHNPCASHDRWSRVREASRAPMRSTTIADLLPNGVGNIGPKYPHKSGETENSEGDLVNLLYLS